MLTDRHMRLHSEDRLMPILSFDPFFPGQRGDDRPPTAMAFYDSDTRRLAVTMLPSKSAEHPYCSRWLATQIELSGHPEVILKTDNEWAVLKMKKLAVGRLKDTGIRVVPEEKPAEMRRAIPTQSRPTTLLRD